MTDGHPQNTVNVSTFIPEGFIFVPFLPQDEREIAAKLIAAAGENYGAVMAQSGGFLVPAEIAAAAALDGVHAAPIVPDVPAEPVSTTTEVPPGVVDSAAPAPAPAPKKAAKAAAADDAPAAS